MIGANFPDTLRRAQAGDDASMEQLYRDLAPLVTGYARAQGASSPDDLAGDVFVAMVQRLGTFSGDERGFRSWLLTICHRRVVDERRRDGRRPGLVPLDEVRGRLVDASDQEGQALARLRAGGVLDAVDALTDDQRAVFLLRTLADLPVRDVAAIVDKPETAVKALHRRALEAIRRALREAGVDETDPG